MVVDSVNARSAGSCRRSPIPGRTEVKGNLRWASCPANACPGLTWHEGVMHIAGVTRGGWKKRKLGTLGPCPRAAKSRTISHAPGFPNSSDTLSRSCRFFPRCRRAVPPTAAHGPDCSGHSGARAQMTCNTLVSIRSVLSPSHQPTRRIACSMLRCVVYCALDPRIARFGSESPGSSSAECRCGVLLPFDAVALDSGRGKKTD